jgi:hypothetical protein
VPLSGPPPLIAPMVFGMSIRNRLTFQRPWGGYTFSRHIVHNFCLGNVGTAKRPTAGGSSGEGVALRHDGASVPPLPRVVGGGNQDLFLVSAPTARDPGTHLSTFPGVRQ